MTIQHPVSRVDVVPPQLSSAGRRARRAIVLVTLATGCAALLFAPSALAQKRGGGGAPLAGPTTTAPTRTEPSHNASQLAAAALTRVGSPYETSATGPNAFDCSGLITWAADQVGIDVPRVSFAEYHIGQHVNRQHIHAGDLVFFDTAGPGASDVGIATGPRTEVSATVHGGVMVHPIFDDYWGTHFLGARRLDHR